VNELEALKKAISDLQAAVKTGHEEVIANVSKMVEEKMKAVSARKTEFHAELSHSASEEVIVSKMPKELKHGIDHLFIASKIMRQPVQSLKSWNKWSKEAGEFKKALDTAASGGGNEWVPTDFTAELLEDVRLAQRVAGLFPMINMPSNPYKVPTQIGRLGTFKQAEQTADTGQTKIPVADGSSLTSNVQFNAVGHASRVLFSAEVNEDSIVPILPFLRSEIVRAIADGREDIVLNGDITATHQDSDTTAADSRRKIASGVRKAALAASATQSLATFNLSNLREMRKKMLKYGVNPADLAWVFSLKGYVDALKLDEVTTLEKYGPSATVLAGELGRLDGIPVIVSEFQREDLNASGVHDGVTTTKSVVNLVHRPSFWWGVRRGAEVRLLDQLYAESDQMALIVKERIDFRSMRGTDKVAALGINLAA
jgi:HK97 family phage major capsid protein